jgi:Cu2+-exporting ATPase
VTVIGADGSRREIPSGQIVAGQSFIAASGRTVPVDARLLTREATFNLAWINGEAEPRIFREGQRVPSGAVALDRSEVLLEALEAWPDSLLAKLLGTERRDDFRHRLVERIVQGYLVGILLVSALAGVGWWVASGDLLHAGAVVTAVLVVSCPCALGLAIPLADEMATVALRRHGVFVRAGDLWPRLTRLRKVVFDKTGTLTRETPVLRNAEAIAGLSDEAKSALLGLVRDNPHPVSRALLEALVIRGGGEPLAGEVRETIGAGVALGDWTLGRADWCAAPGETGLALREGGVVLRRAGREVAGFHFADAARPGAREELAALARRGLEIFVLSGDRREKVAALVRELGLRPDSGVGALSPEGKAAWLETCGADDTLMLGDGANDSLAFDRALCRGTPAVHRGMLSEKADFYYLGQGIAGVRALLEVDEARRRTGVFLLVFMIAYNLAAVGFAVAGLMNPLFAAVLMPLSSLATLAIVGVGMRRIWARGAAGT